MIESACVSWGDLRLRSIRTVVLVAVFLAAGLAVGPNYDQRAIAIPDPYGYDFAIHNFAEGKWYLNNAEMNKGLVEAVQNGENLVMYVPAGSDRWVLGKSPGYPLLVIPFQWLGIPRLANVVLAALAAYALYKVITIRYAKRVALLAVIVFLFSPISLLAMHYATMDTFAGGALLAISGSILLYAHLELGTNGVPGRFLLLAGLAAGWAVVARIHNLPILLLLSMFVFISTIGNDSFSLQTKRRMLPLFFLGVAGSLTLLLLYNKVVFGAFFDTGYRYPSPFQHLYLWEAEPATEVYGVKTWLAEGTLSSLLRAVFQHVVWWLEPLLRGWPLFPLVLSALLLLIRHRQFNLYYLTLLAWLAATYALYSGVFYFGVTRELVVPFYRTTGFFAVTRYLYPAVFPITLLTVEALRRMPARVADGLMLCLVAGSTIWYLTFVS